MNRAHQKEQIFVPKFFFETGAKRRFPFGAVTVLAVPEQRAHFPIGDHVAIFFGSCERLALVAIVKIEGQLAKRRTANREPLLPTQTALLASSEGALFPSNRGS